MSDRIDHVAEALANVLKIEEFRLRAQGWQPTANIAAALDIEEVQS